MDEAEQKLHEAEQQAEEAASEVEELRQQCQDLQDQLTAAQRTAKSPSKRRPAYARNGKDDEEDHDTLVAGLRQKIEELEKDKRELQDAVSLTWHVEGAATCVSWLPHAPVVACLQCV